MKTHLSRLALLLSVSLLSPLLLGWQDDIEINLRNPYSQFGQNQGLGFFQGANAEARVGRYLLAPHDQTWRGGAEGDVALLSYGSRWLWQIGLNLETVADDQNDIRFRLIHAYYQAMTGAKLRLGPGLLYIGYRHRCSHGADRASESRITIRSGLTSSYHWVIKTKSIQFDIKPGFNFYVFGQNRDYSMQPRGGVFLSANAVWPIIEPFFVAMGAGTNLEMVSTGSDIVYLFTEKFSSWHIEPLWAGRLAMRVDQGLIKADFGLKFAQHLDVGVGKEAKKASSLSFAIDFQW